MRSHNKILAVAITTALSTSFSNLYAIQDYVEKCKQFGTDLSNTSTASPVPPTQFENVGGASWANCIILRAGETAITTGTRPNAVFDFTAGQTVISANVSQTAGISYAAELFGGTGLIIPTPLTSGSTPDYLGVIYTIDGTIPTDFEATFTLDNNATFAENPILGVRDDKAGLNALVASVAPSVKTAAVSGVSADTVFRFENHSTVYLGTTGSNPVAPGTANFYQLGVLEAAYPTTTVNTGAAQSVAASLKVYTNTVAVAVPAVKSSAVATITATGGLAAAGTSSPAIITVTDSTKLKTGWTYACDNTATVGSATTGTVGVHLFTVTPTTTANAVTITTATPTTTNWAVAGTTASGWSTTNSFGNPTAECANNALIYRIHVPGDTVISLEGTTTTNFAVNNFYTFDVATPNCNLADITTPTLYKVTTTTGADNSITITPPLATPLCAGMKGYKTDIDLSDNWKPSGTMSPVPAMAPKTSASGTATAKFTMDVEQTSKKDILEGGDQLMLLYKLSNVGILADPTQKINMTIDLQTGGAASTLINPKRTVTVATSAKALDVSLISGEGQGKLNISVSSGSTQFSGEIAPTAGLYYGYVSNTTARIGQLKIIYNSPIPKMADAFTDFTLSSDAVAADSSKLVITGGQFQASKNIPGSVQLRLSGGGSITADEITVDLEGAWQATWDLDSNDLGSIANSTVDFKGAMIEITVDSTTEINSVEGPPVGNLTIDFNNTSYKDIELIPVDLRKITKDGNVCTVYNVPPPTNGVMGADVVSIRVTNDSAIAGKLMGKFFAMDGGEPMWTGDLLAGEEIQPGTTIRLESDILAKLMGITWEGRGVLQISSTIPEMEVMALIRQNGIKFAPLSNLSTGARGSSCTQE